MTADNVVLFDAQAKNGLGQYSAYSLADGRTVTKEYHHGFLLRTHAEDIQDLHLAFDYCTANVTSRWDAVKSLKESFEYDALNRLTSAQVFPVDANGIPTGLSFPPVQYGYDGDIGSTNGNLALRDDVGQLGYGVHAVTAARNIDYPTPLDAPPFAISQATQDVSYTPYLKPHKVNETVGTDAFELEFEYGPELQRTRSMLRRNGTTVNTKVYLGDYEVQTIDGIAEQIHYITGGDGLCAIITQGSGSARIHATYTDHLGSIVAVTRADGILVAEQSFDAWGRHRKPEDWSTNYTPALPNWLYRGYTGHEHTEPFGLINMNSRMYDPLTGRMLSSDNYVNGQSATQAFNRYTYAANNPLSYTDPTGDIAWAPIIIGAVIGAYSGGVMSNQGEYNPVRWDYSASRTQKYMVGGAVIGAVAGAASYAVATSGMPAANTAAVVAGSYTNSVGMHIMSGGQAPVGVSVGAASYSFDSGKVGYLGDPENTTLETIGYSLGAIANLGDALAGMHPGDVQLVTDHSDAIGHSALTDVGVTDDYNSIVSVGPDPAGKWIFNPLKAGGGNPDWSNHISDGAWQTIVKGVNTKTLQWYGSNRGNVYNLYWSSCVNHTARALTLSGVPSIGIHPFILHAQMAARSVFLRPSVFSYHLLQW